MDQATERIGALSGADHLTVLVTNVAMILLGGTTTLWLQQMRRR